MGNVASALLNTGIVCAGITATVGYAILLLSPVDSIVMESGKNSYEVQLFPFLDAFSRFNLEPYTGHIVCLRMEE